MSVSSIDNQIKSYVFLDIEATGLPDLELNRTKITEISLVGCSKDQIVDATQTKLPRVLHKLTLCFNPQRLISPASTDISGLDNFMLEYENIFNENSARTIINFLEHLRQPICIIAQNGNKFDFPILQKEFNKLNLALSDTIFCIDSLPIFRKIDQLEEIKSSEVTKDLVDELIECEQINWQQINEKTPSHSRQLTKVNSKIEKNGGPSIPRKRLLPKELFPEKGTESISSKKKFGLSNIYERIYGSKPPILHYAEADSISLMKCVIAMKEQFLPIAEKDSILFSTIKPINK